MLTASRRIVKPLPRIKAHFFLSINDRYAPAKYIGLREFAVISTKTSLSDIRRGVRPNREDTTGIAFPSPNQA
jgi:hypothetical protein